jgi:hypothetical protein
LHWGWPRELCGGAVRRQISPKLLPARSAQRRHASDDCVHCLRPYDATTDNQAGSFNRAIIESLQAHRQGAKASRRVKTVAHVQAQQLGVRLGLLRSPLFVRLPFRYGFGIRRCVYTLRLGCNPSHFVNHNLRWHAFCKPKPNSAELPRRTR